MSNNTKTTTSQSMAFSLVDPELKINVPSYNENYQKNDKNYTYWGDDNKFPNKLLTLAEESPTLSSVLSGTVSFILGNGVAVEDNTSFFARKVNKNNETIADIVEQIAYDKLLFGGYAIQVIYNVLKQPVEIYAVPMEFIRTNRRMDRFWYNDNWGKYSTNAIIYNKFNKDEIDDSYTQIFYSKNSGSRRVYPTSPQTGALNDIVSENIAAKYTKNSLESGLSARFIINMPNTAKLTDEQKAKIEDGIKKKFTGVDNAGTFMLYFNSTTEKLDITKVDHDNSNEIFKSIRDAARENIFIVNKATPNLFGLPTASTGFNSQEHQDAYSLYYKLVVYPIQKQIAEDLSKIIGTNVLIEPFSIDLDKQDVSVVDENTNEKITE